MVDFRNLTLGQRWRLRRNLAISDLNRNGWSQRLLADVFDLPRSRIAAVVREMEALACESDSAGSGRGARMLNSLHGRCKANSARPLK